MLHNGEVGHNRQQGDRVIDTRYTTGGVGHNNSQQTEPGDTAMDTRYTTGGSRAQQQPTGRYGDGYTVHNRGSLAQTGIGLAGSLGRKNNGKETERRHTLIDIKARAVPC